MSPQNVSKWSLRVSYKLHERTWARVNSSYIYVISFMFLKHIKLTRHVFTRFSEAPLSFSLRCRGELISWPLVYIPSKPTWETGGKRRKREGKKKERTTLKVRWTKEHLKLFLWETIISSESSLDKRLTVIRKVQSPKPLK